MMLHQPATNLTSQTTVVSRKHIAIALLAVLAILVYLVLWLADASGRNWPLFVALGLGGTPLLWDLSLNLVKREFGADLLAGISIVTSVLLDEYLAGTLVVLMLSGGEALEVYAVQNASSVLKALAGRMPSTAHRQHPDQSLEEVPIDTLNIGDTLVVLPHETCPVDGTVLEGHGTMDESYLTGEPYAMSKTPGVSVLSGAINGQTALTIRADRKAIDSRYARIMEVMRASQQQRPKLRRMGDSLGAWYTPFALLIALLAWGISGDAVRFLAVLVVATPCPLLIAIPVSIISSVSLAAKQAIIIRDPVVLEKIDTCTTMIFDKTGTLTYGKPALTDQHIHPGTDADEILALVASLERYSKHPLAQAVVAAGEAHKLPVHQATEMTEPPGQGLTGRVQGRLVEVTSRKHIAQDHAEMLPLIPEVQGGLECVVLIDEKFAAVYRFRDAPRKEGKSFIDHLGPRHKVNKVMLVSGDRASEVQYLADAVGITEVFGGQSPEQKVAIVRAETAKNPTAFVGDGINDAPALLAATVGIAMGTQSDVTTEAAGAVIMDSSLRKIDQLMHIGRRMRRIALQSVLIGMSLSIVGMGFAAAGYLPPVTGAILQEGIDIFAVLNALRTAMPRQALTDY
ncbi:heavy metal translocating P-type ATPase [Phycisphaeraceae bacterium D3-23]